MKSTNLVAATLSIAAVATAVALSPAVRAQDTNKPTVQANPSTGQPVMMVPANASQMDKYKASWSYRNLDAIEVKRYRSEGFSDGTIRGAANIALNTGLELPFVLRQVREVGVPLYNLAASYGLSTRTVDSDVPGYGLESISITPAMPGPMPAPTVMTQPMTTGNASSASMSSPATTANPAPDANAPAATAPAPATVATPTPTPDATAPAAAPAVPTTPPAPVTPAPDPNAPAPAAPAPAPAAPTTPAP